MQSCWWRFYTHSLFYEKALTCFSIFQRPPADKWEPPRNHSTNQARRVQFNWLGLLLAKIKATNTFPSSNLGKIYILGTQNLILNQSRWCKNLSWLYSPLHQWEQGLGCTRQAVLSASGQKGAGKSGYSCPLGTGRAVLALMLWCVFRTGADLWSYWSPLVLINHESRI